MYIRTLSSALLALLVFMPPALAIILGPSGDKTEQNQPTLTKADIDRMMTELSNWGRWGKEDQLGAVNLITPAKRKQAAAMVKEGVSVSLAHDVEK